MRYVPLAISAFVEGLSTLMHHWLPMGNDGDGLLGVMQMPEHNCLQAFHTWHATLKVIALWADIQ